jgi:hypothetical protein
MTSTQVSDNFNYIKHQLQGNDVTCSESGYIVGTFKSAQEIHKISVEIDMMHKEALVCCMEIEHSSPVELAILLKDISCQLKKVNIETIIQQVLPGDWETILKPLNIFNLVNMNTKYNFYNIRCSIDKFPEGIMKSLGFVDIDTQY